jgi:competence protein ComEA
MAHRSIPPAPDPVARSSPAFAPIAPPLRWDAVADRARRRPAGIVAAMGIALVALGLAWWLLRPAAPPMESTLPLATSGAPGATDGATPDEAGDAAAAATTIADGSTAATSTTTPKVVVQAAGAVASPGLYRLEPGARVDDLIRAAGGLTERADRDRINLASAVNDGERIWIPLRGQADPPDVVTATPGSTASGAAPSTPTGEAGSPGASPAPAAGPIDLNTADAAALDALPGVGPATATAILSYREQTGPFSSVDELLEVRGIGEAKLEQLRPLVRV